MNFKGTITRNSNGSIEITAEGGNVPRALSMGSEVDVAITVTKTAEDIEAEHAEKKAAKAGKPVEGVAASSVPPTKDAPRRGARQPVER